MKEDDLLLDDGWDKDEDIDLRAILFSYLRHWKWFVLSAFIAVLLAFLYLRYKALPLYQVDSEILLLEQEGGNVEALSVLKDLDVYNSGGGKANDELAVLRSRRLMTKTIKDLGYHIKAYTHGRIKRNTEVLYSSLPFEVTFFIPDSLLYETNYAFKIKPLSKTNFEFEDVDNETTSSLQFNKIYKLPIGNVRVNWKGALDPEEDFDRDYLIVVSPLLKVVDNYRNRLQISVEKSSYVMRLSLTDPLKEKAKHVIDRLVDNYTEDAAVEKSRKADLTAKFLDERLDIISNDLERLDGNIQQFKQRNELTDIEAEASLFLTDASTTQKKIAELETRKTLAGMMKSYIQSRPNDLIPVNLGLEDPGIASLIANYNELILERNYLAQSATGQNPIIENLNNEVDKLKNSLHKSLNNLSSSVDISLSKMRSEERKLSAQLSTMPKKEREFRDIKRQQQIIEELYLFLLQRREETAISSVIVPSKVKIIDRAFGPENPVSPKKNVIYLAALLLGLLIPFALIYIRQLLDNKIRKLEDLESIVKLPVLGIIPKAVDTHIMENNSHTEHAEAFRILRTNTNFVVSSTHQELHENSGKTHIIMVTSSIPGEGKTYISSNLAATYAFQNKRVLLIGADIRKPKLTEFFDIHNPKGLTNFLVGDTQDPKELIQKMPKQNLDILNAGPIPPNPTELIGNGRFNELLDKLENEYDYILIDTAPVSVVSDTLLIQKRAHAVVYVVRANYVEKDHVGFLNTLIKEKKLKHVGLVLNDVQVRSGYGYGKYGYTTYGYGYHQEGSGNNRWKKWLRKW